MTSTNDRIPSEFAWERQQEAAEFVHLQLSRALGNSPWLKQFQAQLKERTGTRLFDWVDHLSTSDAGQVAELGFIAEYGLWSHPGALLPPLVVETADTPTVGIKVDSIDDFRSAQQLSLVDDQRGRHVRVATFDVGSGIQLKAVERQGCRGVTPDATSTSERAHAGETAHAARVLDSFRRRRRDFADDTEGYDHARELILAGLSQLGRDWTCHLFFRAEREFWQSRNRAARVQHDRQQRLGMGWANHDHHTYRCSRENFSSLVANFELLGCACRERFYAGADAGWGAQVLEQTACGIVIFADVDMTVDEISGDFSHEGLTSRDELGTVGLWTKLHGDSFLQAGMHHLECQFDFDAARKQLQAEGIETMPPFSDFPHLRQAFTVGERWPVEPNRINALLNRGSITSRQADDFRRDGAIGSHLEILERNDGYKGFNQEGINEIIHATDPRGSAAP